MPKFRYALAEMPGARYSGRMQQPIQNTYVGVVEAGKDGSPYIKLTGTVQEMKPDNFAAKCTMK